MPENKTDNQDNWIDEEAPKAMRSEPLTFQERFVLKNLFDTQPKRRKEYLRQIGFQMNDKNIEEIRPLGSDEPFKKIDPGPIEALYDGKTIAERAKNYAIETGKDVSDIIGDLASQVVIAGTAKSGEAFAKGVTGGLGPAGQLTGQIVGGIAGGALGAGAAEKTKEMIGNIYLDNDIPANAKLMAVQSLVAGMAPKIVEGGAHAFKKFYATYLAKSVESLKNSVKAAAGNVSQELLDDAVANPQKYTPQSVEGSMKKLSQKFKDFFGVDPEKALTNKSTRQFSRDSVVGKLMRPLNEAADAEINKLSGDEAANFTIGEIYDGLDSKARQLASKFDLTDEDRAALNYLNEKKSFLLEKAQNIFSRIKPAKKDIVSALKEAPEAGIDELKNVQINFKDARDFLKVVQDDFFNQEKLGKSVIAPFARNLREIADQKATSAGSNLAQINAKRSAALELSNQAQEALKPGKIIAAYAPGKVTPEKIKTDEILTGIDSMAGTDFKKQFEDLINQTIFEQGYKVTAPYASGRARAAAASEAMKQAVQYGTMGAAGGSAIPVVGTKAGLIGGTIFGAAKGFKEGSLLANPEYALSQFSKQALKSQAAEEALKAAPTALEEAIAQGAGLLARQVAKPAQSMKEPDLTEEDDWTK